MKYLFAAASLSIIAMSAPAFAQEQAPQNRGVYANLGYANFGRSDIDLDTIQGRPGYRFNDYAGVEGELAGGIGSDKSDVAPGVEAKTKLRHQEAIYGVGFLPVTPKLDLIGRVGYGATKVRTKVASVSASDSQESWNVGAGAQYHLDGQNGVRADYTRQEYVGGPGHADVWSIGYSRRFR